MKLSTIFPVAFAATLIFTSCSKDETNYTGFNAREINSMSDVKAPDDFNWSSSFKGSIAVSLNAPAGIAIENEWLLLTDAQGNTLDRARVKSGNATFNISLPKEKEVQLYYPNTGDTQILTKAGTVEFTISDLSKIENLDTTQSKSAPAKKTVTAGNDVLLDEDFSNPSITADLTYEYLDYITSDDWVIGTGGYSIHNQGSGNTVLKINNISQGTSSYFTSVGKRVEVVPGTSFTLSADFGGSSSMTKILGIVFYNSSHQYVGMAYGYVYYNNSTKTITGTVPYSAAYGSVMAIFAYGNGSVWIDNVKLLGTSAIQDADNDGIADESDDYPNDPARAYKSAYPNTGKQTVAFEDLWPATADYDFNDVKLSSIAVISKDANGDLVDASFKVSLDALGAGNHNGIGLMIYDASGNAFSNNVISSVSGDAGSDADNPNGVIVTNDVFKSIGSYYQNNGAGPAATPDTLEFTITFNSNAGSSFTPELYIFKTDDRSREVHLAGRPGTAAADQSLFYTNEDNGNYKTANNLPWAIEVISESNFSHPLEKVDITAAYPQFAQWAISGGSLSTDWSDNGLNTQLF